MQNRKTLIGLMTVLAVILIQPISLRSLEAPAGDVERQRTTFLERLKPGEMVSLQEKDGRYDLTLLPKAFRPLSHTILEVNHDHVLLRDIAEITDTAIPIYSIKAITILRVGGK